MNKYASLAELLKAEDIKWSFLSEKLGINRSSVSRWKSGKTKPQMTVVQWQIMTRFLKEFEVDILDISEDFFQKEKPSPIKPKKAE
jgi:transcriptional regulator with XRE-family HTH domain